MAGLVRVATTRDCTIKRMEVGNIRREVAKWYGGDTKEWANGTIGEGAEGRFYPALNTLIE